MEPKRPMDRINTLNLLDYAPQPGAHSSSGRAPGSYSMVRLERTAGGIPSYDSFYDKTSPKTAVLSQDEAFEKLVQEQLNPQDNTYSLTLDEQKMENAGATKEGERFSIFDFLDMVNPLQHIPVVNYAYRYLTGDQIKPISAIIGGAVFAGPAGAASGLVTSVVEHEVGGSLPETALSFASGRKASDGAAAYEKLAGYAGGSPAIDGNYDYNT